MKNNISLFLFNSQIKNKHDLTYLITYIISWDIVYFIRYNIISKISYFIKNDILWYAYDIIGYIYIYISPIASIN